MRFSDREYELEERIENLDQRISLAYGMVSRLSNEYVDSGAAFEDYGDRRSDKLSEELEHISREIDFLKIKFEGLED